MAGDDSRGIFGQKMKNRIFRVFNGYIGSIYLIVIPVMIFVNVIMISPIFIAMALIVMFSIPIIIYSFLMEFVVNPKVANSCSAIFISIVFWGITVGLLLSKPIFMSVNGFNLIPSCIFGFGGALSGMWIRFMYVRDITGQRLPFWYEFILACFYIVAIMVLLCIVVFILAYILVKFLNMIGV